jgi:hypothetical protein
MKSLGIMIFLVEKMRVLSVISVLVLIAGGCQTVREREVRGEYAILTEDLLKEYDLNINQLVGEVQVYLSRDIRLRREITSATAGEVEDRRLVRREGRGFEEINAEELLPSVILKVVSPGTNTRTDGENTYLVVSFDEEDPEAHLYFRLTHLHPDVLPSVPEEQEEREEVYGFSLYAYASDLPSMPAYNEIYDRVTLFEIAGDEGVPVDVEEGTEAVICWARDDRGRLHFIVVDHAGTIIADRMGVSFPDVTEARLNELVERWNPNGEPAQNRRVIAAIMSIFGMTPFGDHRNPEEAREVIPSEVEIGDAGSQPTLQGSLVRRFEVPFEGSWYELAEFNMIHAHLLVKYDEIRWRAEEVRHLRGHRLSPR